MARKKPTVKEIEAKVELLTRVNNQACQMVDNLGNMIKFYIEFKGETEDFQEYYMKKIQEIRKGKKTVIQDRTTYEDAYIFAPNLHSMGLMTTRDFETYFSLFKLQESFITPPDLLIYLRASVPTLVNQIQKRGRDYEESIRLDYLKRLNERYEAWVSTYDQGKLLIIDVDNNNFSEKAEDLGTIINSIDAELHGLFENK